MKNFFYLFLLFTTFSNAQIIEQFPAKQLPYKGGYEGYYKDFQQIILEENLQPCTNPNELYQFTILIKDDASIQFVKDLNEKNVNDNKCAYQLAREVAKHQTGWNPAVIDGVKQNAVARFIIYPADLFNNYREGYFPNYTPPLYLDKKKGKRRNFTSDFVSTFDKRRFDWNDLFVIMAEFIITKEGKVKDILITKRSGVYEFDREIENTIKVLAKNWIPATINGNPIDDRYSFVIKGVTDPE